MDVFAFGVFWEAGYLLYSMVLRRGDWAIMAEAYAPLPPMVWRSVGVLLASVFYAAGIRGLASALRLHDEPGPTRPTNRGPSPLRLSWLSAAACACVAALAYAPARSDAVSQAALEVGAAACPMWFVARQRPLPVARSLPWIAAAALLFVGFVLTLGRGLP